MHILLVVAAVVLALEVHEHVPEWMDYLDGVRKDPAKWLRESRRHLVESLKTLLISLVIAVIVLSIVGEIHF